MKTLRTLRNLVLLLWVVVCTVPAQLQAQKPTDPPVIEFDTTQTRKGKDYWTPYPGERFDLVFNRGFLVTGDAADSIPISTTSGTTFIGASFNVIFNKTLSLHLTPGVTFYKLVFNNNAAESFQPITDTTVGSDVGYKLRSYYLEMPIGLGVVLKRDTAKGKVKTQLEAGLSVGYLIGSSLKYKIAGDDGQQLNTNNKGIFFRDFERLRLGAYLKYTYKFIGLFLYNRLTPVFRSEAEFGSESGPLPYPSFPSFEIGLTFNL